MRVDVASIQGGEIPILLPLQYNNENIRNLSSILVTYQS